MSKSTIADASSTTTSRDSVRPADFVARIVVSSDNLVMSRSDLQWAACSTMLSVTKAARNSPRVLVSSAKDGNGWHDVVAVYRPTVH